MLSDFFALLSRTLEVFRLEFTIHFPLTGLCIQRRGRHYRPYFMGGVLW